MRVKIEKETKRGSFFLAADSMFDLFVVDWINGNLKIKDAQTKANLNPPSPSLPSNSVKGPQR